MIAHVKVGLPTCPHCGAEDLKVVAPDPLPGTPSPPSKVKHLVNNCYCCAKDYRLTTTPTKRGYNYSSAKV